MTDLDLARERASLTATDLRPDTGRVNDVTTKEHTMHLIHEALARSHSSERLREAERQRRAVQLAAARRWQRRAEAAGRRARAAAIAASH